jgi:hypothetical protein
MTNQKVTLGSVSHGTMRPEDLIPQFMDVLASLSTPEERIEGELLDAIDRRMCSMDGIYYHDSTAAEDLEALFTALNNHAPPYTHFGAHSGDTTMDDTLAKRCLNLLSGNGKKYSSTHRAARHLDKTVVRDTMDEHDVYYFMDGSVLLARGRGSYTQRWIQTTRKDKA